MPPTVSLSAAFPMRVLSHVHLPNLVTEYSITSVNPTTAQKVMPHSQRIDNCSLSSEHARRGNKERLHKHCLGSLDELAREVCAAPKTIGIPLTADTIWYKIKTKPLCGSTLVLAHLPFALLSSAAQRCDFPVAHSGHSTFYIRR